MSRTESWREQNRVGSRLVTFQVTDEETVEISYALLCSLLGQLGYSKHD